MRHDIVETLVAPRALAGGRAGGLVFRWGAYYSFLARRTTRCMRRRKRARLLWMGRMFFYVNRDQTAISM